ncbi:DUF397 domain-containing protein [Streptomyces sp. WMMB 322]|uniref:DUF397 domain-containing protein n=1 Tax=Streptomyces sp. WMMB 322 TaxID=1286821 RepID=UPI0006E1CA12|nr:DUF397 domain-containing protein [Streptomyces sp. WMMB 322]SCK46863.1 protein of unknown function [Streptomyces sp. WMMB 322]
MSAEQAAIVPDLTWFKSSYSSSQGDNCVEVAVGWRKSSYSGGEGGACVEFAACPSAVHVRDSKDADGPQLTVALGAWAAFVGLAAGETVA